VPGEASDSHSWLDTSSRELCCVLSEQMRERSHILTAAAGRQRRIPDPSSRNGCRFHLPGGSNRRLPRRIGRETPPFFHQPSLMPHHLMDHERGSAAAVLPPLRQRSSSPLKCCTSGPAALEARGEAKTDSCLKTAEWMGRGVRGGGTEEN
jgi:hypothetical protein